jgi:glutamine amidotransferase/cyclase
MHYLNFFKSPDVKLRMLGNATGYTPNSQHVCRIRESETIPVIASSGAGCVEHFSEVFQKTDVEAALAAGIFHRKEVPIETVKEHMREKGIETR